MRLGAKADGGGQRLTGQQLGSIGLTVADTIERLLPVDLAFEGDAQALVLGIVPTHGRWPAGSCR